MIKCSFCHLLRVVWYCKYTNFVQKNEKKSFICTKFHILLMFDNKKNVPRKKTARNECTFANEIKKGTHTKTR